MERVTGVGGVFFRAADPQRLAAWYADHLGIVLEPFGGAVFRAATGEETVWAPFPADTAYFGRREQHLMINYRVSNLDAILEQLRRGGVDVDGDVHEEATGRFAWAVDPEGNRFELWEPRA